MRSNVVGTAAALVSAGDNPPVGQRHSRQTSPPGAGYPPVSRWRHTLAYHLLPVVFLVGAAAFVFRQTLFFGNRLLGNSDRLNDYLSFVLYHTHYLERGQFAAWSDFSFDGFDTTSLPMGFPTPLFFLPTVLHSDDVVAIFGVVAFVLLALALLEAYAVIYLLCGDRLAALAGATTYAGASYGLLKLVQSDQTYLSVLTAPCFFFLIHTTAQHNWPRHFLVLALLVAVECYFAFLQEFSYNLIFFFVYSAYLFLRHNRYPLVTFTAAVAAGILLSVPRLLAQYANLASYGRGRAAPVLQDTVDVPTLLRFFSRDIFGHSWRDQLQLPAADQLNFHEGDLLHSSVFGALLLALIILSFHWLSKRDTRAPSSLRYYSLVFVPYILFVFAVMHVPRVYLLFARLYLNVSFQHSRVAVSAMLPVAILVALFIAQYRGPLTRRHVPIVALVSLVVVSVSAVSVPRLLDRVAPSRPLYVSCNSCLSLLHFTHLFTSDLVRLLGLSVAFALIVGAGFASGSAGRRIMATVLAVGITFQTIWGAADYLEGPQTRDYTIPWENNDFVVAPPDQFLPPTPNEMEQLHMLLDNNDFRSITLCPSHYPNCSTTIGMTWGVRLADGYTSGVPHRLAVLPSLPAELHNLRWDSAAAVGRAWRTLAFLNVRQALTIDRKFYMNMRLRVPDDIVIVRNPSSFVYPRAYFARTIQAVDAMGDEAAVVQELDACQSDCQGLQERFATDFVEGGVSGSYDDSGDLHWSGGGDRLSFDFPASDQPRFLVVNDMWDHGWSAVAGNQPVPVWPTNVAMRGIPIPPGASHLELVYHSFLWWLWWYLPATIALNMLAVVVVRRRLGARA